MTIWIHFNYTKGERLEKAEWRLVCYKLYRTANYSNILQFLNRKRKKSEHFLSVLINSCDGVVNYVWTSRVSDTVWRKICKVQVNKNRIEIKLSLESYLMNASNNNEMTFLWAILRVKWNLRNSRRWRQDKREKGRK